MSTIKNYTDIEQSKVLAKILPIESADMWYEDCGLMIPRLGHIPKEHTNTEIPCWSLAALFKMLPYSARLERGYSTELCYVTLPNELESSDWYIEPVDAVFEMILKLYELKML